jgi:hypothetical protein
MAGEGKVPELAHPKTAEWLSTTKRRALEIGR